MPKAPDLTEDLNALAAEINEINRANGWNVISPHEWGMDGRHEYRLGTLLALIHSEVSEALEAVRRQDRPNFQEELADVLIRVLDVAGGLGVDMGAVVRAKLERNKQRGYRHGGKAF